MGWPILDEVNIVAAVLVDCDVSDPPNTKLFLIYDDCEQLLVAARSPKHMWHRVEHHLGTDAADELMLSRVDEYPEPCASEFLARCPSCFLRGGAYVLQTPEQVRDNLAIDKMWRV